MSENTKVVPKSPTNRQRKRRLSFADEYDGGKLDTTVFAENLHYSKDTPQNSGGGDGGGNDNGGKDGGGGGCCVIS
jgi:hypothetical protein